MLLGDGGKDEMLESSEELEEGLVCNLDPLSTMNLYQHSVDKTTLINQQNQKQDI